MFGHNDDQTQPQTDNSTGANEPATPQNWPHPGTPLNDASSDASSAQPTSSANPGDLAELKQKVLGELSPLVDHLDQSPEEKFRILMMMIQATDDQSLLQEAYDTAEKITDDKTKAQALLDVVNEINYFAQQHKN